MVKYGIEDWPHQSSASTASSINRKPPPHLVIYTNEITEQILESVNTDKFPNIIFEIPSSGYRYFDMKADLYTWRIFARNIESLCFRGTLVEKQFTVKHFEDMNQLKYLTIGATSYPLFEGEDTSNLPAIRRFIGSGYGLVKKSEDLEKWLRKLKLNAEVHGAWSSDYYLH